MAPRLATLLAPPVDLAMVFIGQRYGGCSQQVLGLGCEQR